MWFVVAYDIRSPKRLAKVARVMKNYGTRVQKSVFECDLDEKLYAEMKRKIQKALDLRMDSVRYYALCERCWPRLELSGPGIMLETEDVVIV